MTGVFKAGKLQGRHSIVFSEWSVRSCISDREYHVSVFLISRPETTWKWRGLLSQFDVFMVEADKLNIKRHIHGLLLSMRD